MTATTATTEARTMNAHDYGRLMLDAIKNADKLTGGPQEAAWWRAVAMFDPFPGTAAFADSVRAQLTHDGRTEWFEARDQMAR